MINLTNINYAHPNLISDFVELLDDILSKTGSYAIVATHSSYFVREVCHEQVHVYKERENDQIDIISPRLSTFGSNISSISHFVIGEVIEPRLAKKLVKKAREKGYTYKDLISECNEQVSVKTLVQINKEWAELSS